MTDGPIPLLAPQGVSVVHPDGQRIPVELEYHGTSVNDDGKIIYRWGIATEIDWQPGDSIEVDVFPDCTALAVPRGWTGES